MIRVLYSSLLSIALATTALAAEFDPFKGPRPLAVMVETNPWLMVIGSDTPSFVLYEDRRVVYLEREPPSGYMTKQLSEEEFLRLKAKLSEFVGPLRPNRYINLAPNVTDQPQTKFFVDIAGETMVTTVYGLAQQRTAGSHKSSALAGEKPDLLPERLDDLYSFMSNLSFPDASKWVPEHVEVMVWSYDYAPDESIHWPQEWPGLHSSTTIKRGDSHSIFMPGSEAPRLREFLSTRNEKGAVEIDGMKLAASVRDTFPSEPVWFKAFQRQD